MNERVGWVFLVKQKSSYYLRLEQWPMGCLKMSGNGIQVTTNKNVLSNTFLLVSSIFVCYQYHTTKPFIHLFFFLFSVFTSKTFKLKKSNNNKTRYKPYKLFQNHSELKIKGHTFCSKCNAYC